MANKDRIVTVLYSFSSNFLFAKRLKLQKFKFMMNNVFEIVTQYAFVFMHFHIMLLAAACHKINGCHVSSKLGSNFWRALLFQGMGKK